MFVDINSDVGESYGNYIYGNDEENMAYLSSVNVACGLHAGDPLVMRETVELASKRNIAIGAHPGFPDLQGFGRRKMELRPEEAKNFVIYQIAALDGFLRIAGKKLTHVALHGALSVVAKSDREIAAAVMEGIREYDPGLIFPGMPGLASYKAAKALGMTVATIVPVDLSFHKDGRSIIERKKKPRDPREVARKALKLVKERKLETVDGVDKDLKADILLVHGDGPNVIEILREMRKTLEAEGVKIKPFPTFIREET
jgi:UPF0271 protein